MDRQTIGVHDRVNFARQTPSRAIHILVIVVRNAGSVLVHADHPPVINTRHAARA